MTAPEYERLSLKILRVGLGMTKFSFETDLRVVLIKLSDFFINICRNHIIDASLMTTLLRKELFLLLIRTVIFCDALKCHFSDQCVR